MLVRAVENKELSNSAKVIFGKLAETYRNLPEIFLNANMFSFIFNNIVFFKLAPKVSSLTARLTRAILTWKLFGE